MYKMDNFNTFLLVFIIMLIFRIKIKYESFSDEPDAFISVDLKSKQDLLFR
jgi:hypothetical protein